MLVPKHGNGCNNYKHDYFSLSKVQAVTKMNLDFFRTNKHAYFHQSLNSPLSCTQTNVNKGPIKTASIDMSS